MQGADHLRGYAVDAECDQLVAVGNLQARGAQFLDECGIDVEDAECDQLIGVEVVEVLVLHLAGELETDILNRHAVLLLVVDREADRLHFARVVRVRLKVKDAGTLPVVEKALAVDFAGIARDGEVDVLASSF